MACWMAPKEWERPALPEYMTTNLSARPWSARSRLSPAGVGHRSSPRFQTPMVCTRSGETPLATSRSRMQSPRATTASACLSSMRFMVSSDRPSGLDSLTMSRANMQSV